MSKTEKGTICMYKDVYMLVSQLYGVTENDEAPLTTHHSRVTLLSSALFIFALITDCHKLGVDFLIDIIITASGRQTLRQD